MYPKGSNIQCLSDIKSNFVLEFFTFGEFFPLWKFPLREFKVNLLMYQRWVDIQGLTDIN